ncbi:MAG: glycosyltransferase, partial [Acetatifactor sp.]|nr:glycosyltransferase [Acetatifactor sp.]
MVSVVITTCKREPDILRRAMNSVLCQTYSDWELIVVDDSPEDYALRDAVRQTVEVIRKTAENRILYIAHEANKGACEARNTGLAAATGEYIAYLDDDDEWLPEKLALQVQRAQEAGPRTALIYCGSFVKMDGADRVILKRREYHRGRIYDSLILENYIGSTSFPLMRTECLRAIGGFDVSMQSAQDADVWLRLAARYEIDCVEEPLVYYHL